jgi:hypothetical protein
MAAARSARVLGVHLVDVDHFCHLIELLVCDPAREFSLTALTQPVEGVEEARWQVPYDEKFFEAESCRLLQADVFDVPDRDSYRLAFFFHYLDFAKPLRSSFGPLQLPPPLPRPDHLMFLRYEAR